MLDIVGKFFIALLGIVLTILIIWGFVSGLTYLVDESNRSRGWPTFEDYRGK